MTKKPDLNKILRKIDKLPKKQFGDFELDLKTLPCIKKGAKKKISAMFDTDVYELVQQKAKKHGVSQSSLMNDILKEVLSDKKNKAG